MSLDPFSLVYNGLWTLVERNEELQRHLPVENRIKFDRENATKETRTDADTPELALLVAGIVPIKYSKDSVHITKNYIWNLTTGSYTIDPIYNKIAFELLRSMMDWECVLCPLSWCDCNFVNNCRITTVEEGIMLQNEAGEIEGWSSVWNIEVEMVFRFNALKIKVP